MTLSRRLLAAGALVVGLGLTTACGGSDSPTSPSTPGTPTTPNPAAPRVVQLSPGTLTMSNNTQTLTVTGERFASGLTILIDAPNGVWTTYSGADISFQSATTFTARVILDKVGTWDITVNSGGLESNEVQFSVVAP